MTFFSPFILYDILRMPFNVKTMHHFTLKAFHEVINYDIPEFYQKTITRDRWRKTESFAEVLQRVLQVFPRDRL